MEKSNNSNFLDFHPAQLFTGKCWYVQYHVKNPYTGIMVRKRIKINRIKGTSERTKYGKRLVNQINNKLYGGWNPFKEKEVPKGFTKLLEVMQTFIRQKERELRSDSLRSYRSFVASFEAWLLKTDNINMFCLNFDQSMARDYMNYIYDVKEVSNRTFNNYRRFQLVLFNWMVEYQYIKLNPFEGIRVKKATQKRRDPIPEFERKRIKDYLMKTDYDFYMATQLVYFTLLRPKEICQMKPEYFNFKTQTLYVPAEVSKNGTDRTVTIPDVLMKDLVNWKFNNAPFGSYIFGKNFKPGKEKLDPRRLSKKWSSMRSKLNFGERLKLYSLRDTGIIEMLQNGVSPHEVMRQADHSSLEITTVYLKHAKPRASEQIKRKLESF